MIINCSVCGTKLKAPENSTSKIKCPQCQSIIIPANEKEQVNNKDNTSQQFQAIIKKEVEKTKQEIFNSLLFANKEFQSLDVSVMQQKLSDLTCLICCSNPELQNQLKDAMNSLNYKVVLCKDAYDVGLLINNSFHDIVIVDEIIGNDKEAGNKVLRILNFLPTDKRRKTFVVLISSTHMSRDSYSAFLSGSNLIINQKDIAQFAEILKKELDSHAKFYKTYHDIAENYGR